VVSDAVTTLGSGVDGGVRRVEYAYDGQGNAYLVTSYNAASSGSIVNQVQRAFNGLGQLITEWQEHGGAVNTSTSPKVQYAYSEMASGANHSRLTSVTYPSGYVLTHNYASGLNSDISRLSSLSDSTGTLESYEYLGYGTVVKRGHSQPGVDLTYIAASGTGDAGDQYTGLDRFGRVVDQKWVKSGTSLDRFQYGYDRSGNRLWRDNLVNAAFGELYSYDGLNQLASFDRGILNGTKTGLTGAASRTQAWDYDAVGNWDSATTNGSAQTRSVNRQNEITSVSGATTPTFATNGNMTGDETGKQFVYDAWNRLVGVKNSSGTTLKTYAYDGLGRRVSEAASGVTTDLFYSDSWRVLEEKVGANTTKRYVWSPVYVDALVLRDRDTDANGTLDERLWAQQDANFNVTALVDGSGNVVERFGYDPYGVRTVYDASYNVRPAGSNYDFQHGFQGLWQDTTSGLNEADHRWYSPTLGRWEKIDLIGYQAGDVNLYRFVNNRPLNATDPSGLDDQGLIGGMFGGALTGGAWGAAGGAVGGVCVIAGALYLGVPLAAPAVIFWSGVKMGTYFGVLYGAVIGAMKGAAQQGLTNGFNAAANDTTIIATSFAFAFIAGAGAALSSGKVGASEGGSNRDGMVGGPLSIPSPPTAQDIAKLKTKEEALAMYEKLKKYNDALLNNLEFYKRHNNADEIKRLQQLLAESTKPAEALSQQIDRIIMGK
jgi:RHS repeat-associated protein